MTTSKYDESVRERGAIRCARATMLLYSLASSGDSKTTNGEKQGEMRREIDDLRRKLATEKKRSDRIKLCSLMEMLLLVVLVLLLSTFFLVFFLI
ncbi:unnamed protein product [Cochlearia groenlandica]